MNAEMEIRFYNTLTRQFEPFRPLTAELVTMYSSGPTAYDFASVSTFRSFLFADLLRRFLESSGFDVHQIMNISDVCPLREHSALAGKNADKNRFATWKSQDNRTSGEVENPSKAADYFTRTFLEDGRTLGLRVANEFPNNVPKATLFIAEMQQMIAKFLEQGLAYVGSDGVVYFGVEAFPRFGQLSGNTLEALRVGSGSRIEIDNQSCKRHPADFILWKPDPKHIIKWTSPWGDGYPGRFIECPTIARCVFRTDVLDIRTGGEDLIFPDHECEIAQACAATGNDVFSRFWMHARSLRVQGEKISKPTATLFTIRNILSGKVTGTPVHPAVLRMELIKSHYRAHGNFTSKGLADTAHIVRRLTEQGKRLREACGAVPKQIDPAEHAVVRAFLQALANDLNVSEAMAVVHAWMWSPCPDAAEAYGVLLTLDQVLGVWELAASDCEEQVSECDVTASLCTMIDEARRAHQFSAADAHRQRLIQLGYEVRSSSDGTSAKKKLA